MIHEEKAFANRIAFYGSTIPHAPLERAQLASNVSTLIRLELEISVHKRTTKLKARKTFARNVHF